MLKLAISELVRHANVWIGAFAVAIVCGLIGEYAFCLISSVAQVPSELDLANAGGIMLTSSIIAGLPVIASVANLAVARQRHSFALWQLAGASPRIVFRVVLLQLAACGLIGSLLGGIVSFFLYAPVFPLLFSDLGPSVSKLVITANASELPRVSLFSALIFVCGGFGAARRASRTRPIVALSELEHTTSKIPVLRILLLILSLACTIWFCDLMRTSESKDVIVWGFFLPFPVVGVFAALAPWILPTVLRVWSALLRPFVLSDLAGKEARYSLASSSSMELPVMVGYATLSGFSSALGSLATWYAANVGSDGDFTIGWTPSAIMLGGPLLACVVGATASALMSAADRSQTTVSLISIGATPAEVICVSLIEAVLHMLNALAVGVLAVLLTNALTSWALGVPPFEGLNFSTGLVVCAVGLGLVAIALCAGTLHGILRVRGAK